MPSEPIDLELQATSTGKHHPYGGQKNDSLTFKTDQSVGAGHIDAAIGIIGTVLPRY